MEVVNWLPPQFLSFSLSFGRGLDRAWGTILWAMP